MDGAPDLSSKGFKVEKLLGSGSYGRVYRVQRIADGKTYALKQMSVHKMSASERQGAMNEIRLLASIRCANVVRYREAFALDTSMCIVMEHAPNGDLQSQVDLAARQKLPLTKPQLWSICIQICRGLQALHARNIVHRDLKLANVFRAEGDIVKLGDLGVSKLLKEGLASTMVGTPYNMAPELWQQKPYSTTTDLWALGCCLYELITLRKPFEANNVQELRTRVMSGRFHPLPDSCCPDLKQVVTCLLQLSPSRRPTADKILESSIVQRHLKTDAPPERSRHKEHMLFKTIKVPRALELDIRSLLPPPTYEEAPTPSPTHLNRPRSAFRPDVPSRMAATQSTLSPAQA